MAISENNRWQTNYDSSLATWTLSVSPATIGNILVLLYIDDSTDVAISTGPTGGGANGSGWTKIIAHQDTTTVMDIEMWYAIVGTTGSGTVTVTPGSGTSSTGQVIVYEFTASPLSSWSIDTSGYLAQGATTVSVAYPTLSPAGSGEAYVGWCVDRYTDMTTGSTSGYTYYSLAGTARYWACYDADVTGSQSPTLGSTLGYWDSLGVLLANVGSINGSVTAVPGASFGAAPSSGGPSSSAAYTINPYYIQPTVDL